MRTMRSRQRKLNVKRETLRQLSSRQLARVAGGTDYDQGWYEDNTGDTSAPPPNWTWTENPQSMSTGSRFC